MNDQAIPIINTDIISSFESIAVENTPQMNTCESVNRTEEYNDLKKIGSFTLCSSIKPLQNISSKKGLTTVTIAHVTIRNVVLRYFALSIKMGNGMHPTIRLIIIK